MVIQQTSIQSYIQIHTAQNICLGDRQFEVWKFLRDKPFGCNNRLIAEKLGKPINSITPRVNELVKMGLVEEHHIGTDRITKRQCIFWSLK
jgi:predicted transcriptional regulator